MELRLEEIKDVIKGYLKDTIKVCLPEIIREVASESIQDIIPLREVKKRYGLSRGTLYKYSSSGLITLYRTPGKTFVSVRELEYFIKQYRNQH